MTAQTASQNQLQVFCGLQLHGCPCGYFGDPVRPCTCSPSLVSRYQRRISGPLLDRIDIFVHMPRLEYDKLTDERRGEPSERVRERVTTARQIQQQRFKDNGLLANAEMTPVEVREYCQVEETAQGLLQAAMKQLSLSARAFHRILKLARTIADLEGIAQIKTAHVAEAIQYRFREQV